MGKTQVATIPTDNEVPAKEEARRLMREARLRVKRYLKGKDNQDLNHLGEMPESYDDAIRIIIALQDLLETETTAHKKATDHIVSLLEECNNMNGAAIQQQFFEEIRHESLSKADAQNAAVFKNMSEKLDSQASQMKAMAETQRTMQQELFQLTGEKNSLMATVAIFTKAR